MAHQKKYIVYLLVIGANSMDRINKITRIGYFEIQQALQTAMLNCQRNHIFRKLKGWFNKKSLLRCINSSRLFL